MRAFHSLVRTGHHVSVQAASIGARTSSASVFDGAPVTAAVARAGRRATAWQRQMAALCTSTPSGSAQVTSAAGDAVRLHALLLKHSTVSRGALYRTARGARHFRRRASGDRDARCEASRAITSKRHAVLVHETSALFRGCRSLFPSPSAAQPDELARRRLPTLSQRGSCCS